MIDPDRIATYAHGRATIGWNGFVGVSPTITANRSGAYLDDGYWVTAPTVTTATRLFPAADGTYVTPDHLCPDLLRWENIGPADGLRGRVVRGLFWLMRLWPPRR